MYINIGVLCVQLEEAERRCKSQQDQIFELKQELTNSTAELKLRLSQAERSVIHTFMHTHSRVMVLPRQNDLNLSCYFCSLERLDMEKRRSKQALEDMDSLRQKEVVFYVP